MLLPCPHVKNLPLVSVGTVTLNISFNGINFSMSPLFHLYKLRPGQKTPPKGITSKQQLSWGLGFNTQICREANIESTAVFNKYLSIKFSVLMQVFGELDIQAHSRLDHSGVFSLGF